MMMNFQGFSFATIEAMIDFFYTGQITLNPEGVLEMLKAANFFGVYSFVYFYIDSRLLGVRSEKGL